MFLSRFFRQESLLIAAKIIAHRFQKLRAMLQKTMGNEKENYGQCFSKPSAMFFDAMGNIRAGRLSGGTVATGGDGDRGERFCAEQLREGLLSSREQRDGG